MCIGFGGAWVFFYIVNVRATEDYPELVGEPVCQVKFFNLIGCLDDHDIVNVNISEFCISLYANFFYSVLLFCCLINVQYYLNIGTGNFFHESIQWITLMLTWLKLRSTTGDTRSVSFMLRLPPSPSLEPSNASASNVAGLQILIFGSFVFVSISSKGLLAFFFVWSNLNLLCCY